MFTPLRALILKDLKLFLSDRRAVIMSFAVPIAIASFFGSIFSGAGSAEPARVPIAIVDEDQSPVSQSIVTGVRADKNFVVTETTAAPARDAVRRGRATVGIIVPKGFGEAAGRAFLAGGDKPLLQMVYDPSHAMELGWCAAS